MGRGERPPDLPKEGPLVRPEQRAPPQTKIGRNRPPPAEQHPRRKTTGALPNRHRTRASAVEQHALPRAEIGKLLQQEMRRDPLADREEQQLALLIDPDGGA